MNANLQEKLVVAQFSILDPDGQRSKTQHVGSCWICSAGIPFNCEGVSNHPYYVISDAETNLAENEFDLQEGWQASFEQGLIEELVLRANVDWLFGVAVFEVVLYCKYGEIKTTRPRRLLVVQRGVSNAIYVCDTALKAFDIAEKLARGLTSEIDASLGELIPIPQKLQRGFSLE